jgi:hypothetical protein
VVVRMRQDAAHLESSEIAPSLIDQHEAHKRCNCRAASAAVRQTLGRAAVEDVRQWLPLLRE